MITKKHYIKIAEILNRNRIKIYQFCYIVDDLADYFESDNPNFDRDRFIEAVYEESEG